MLSQVYPENNQRVSMLKPAQKLFLLLPEGALRKAQEDDDLNHALEQMVDSYPGGIKLCWSCSLQPPPSLYEVHWAEHLDLRQAKSISCKQSHCRLYNLELGKRYFWRVCFTLPDGSRYESQIRSFRVEHLAPRVMCLPNILNFRDLGGYLAMQGKYVKQNMIFRSTRLNENANENNEPGAPLFNQESKRIILEELKLKTEIDMRREDETGGMKDSPLGEQVQYHNIPSTTYAGIFSEQGQQNYARLFRIFCRRENYPINFHCSAGADRGGSLAFLLLALLGVSELELAQDYVFTSFYSLREYEFYEHFSHGMAAYGSDSEPMSLKAERYLLKAGVQADQIQAYRDIMLEDLPDSYEYALSWTEISSRCADCLPSKDFAVKPYYPYQEKIESLASSHELALPYWTQSPLQKLGINPQGDYLLHLCNPRSETIFAALQPLADSLQRGRFSVVEPLRRLLYKPTLDEQLWSAEQLADFKIALPPKEDLLLQVSRRNQQVHLKECLLPELAYEAQFLQLPKLEAALAQGAAQLPDLLWEKSPEMKFHPWSEKDLHQLPAAQFVFDQHSQTLYVKVRLPSKEIVSQKREHDSIIFVDDCVEFFLTAWQEPDYYHFAFNPHRSVYDAKNMDRSWHLQEYQLHTEIDPQGWTLKLALPLAQFGFKTPLQLNLACTDQPGALFNLFKPQKGSFHDREFMRIVKLH